MFEMLIFYFIVFAVWVLIVYLTGAMAKTKGYNQGFAIFMGVVFSIFAFIIYWSLPEKMVEKKK